MARILVADDEEGIRSFLAEALELDGHDVTQAVDGQDAADKLAAKSYDLLLTDLKMPRLDGMTLLQRVRAEQPETEIIVLTAHGSVETAVSAMKLGAFDYLQKPLSGLTELRLLARRALERRALLSLKERTARAEVPETPLSYGDPTMAPVLEALRKVAPTNATVLLLGESGTGKEIAARALHRWSNRHAGPFVAVNCAALAEGLLESELFGHEKGAFTGANARRRGCLELSDGGTCFLDEIGELAPSTQAKLLRALQEKQVRRVGGSRDIHVDVRWIAATNQDLGSMIAEGTFRPDLYHRLAVFPIQLPPLRDRRTDIQPLAQTLLRRVAVELGCGPLTLDAGAEAHLRSQSWTGNVRELANALERAAILAGSAVLSAEHFTAFPSLPTATRSSLGAELPTTLAALEREAIFRALDAVGGNRKQAAERLGIGLRTLYDKLKKYGEDE